MPELNEACTECEISVSTAARWFLQNMLCSKAKTRRLLNTCSGVLRTPTSQVCRAGGLQRQESVCQRHFDQIRREDDRRCSCPSTWGHTSKLHCHPIPPRYFEILDRAGSELSSYSPGTRWCNKCRTEAPKRIQNWPTNDENPTKRSKEESTKASFRMTNFS